MRLTSSVSVAQTIIALSSVELTSILVPSHRLRIMALLSSGCRATVDGLTNVQGSSTTQQWQATSLDDNNLHVPCRQSSKHFISGQLKVIPLFRYSVIPYSAFYSIPNFLVAVSASDVCVCVCWGVWISPGGTTHSSSYTIYEHSYLI